MIRAPETAVNRYSGQHDVPEPLSQRVAEIWSIWFLWSIWSIKVDEQENEDSHDRPERPAHPPRPSHKAPVRQYPSGYLHDNEIDPIKENLPVYPSAGRW